MYNGNISCPLLCQENEAEDTQIHLLQCPVLLANLSKEEEEETRLIEYNDMYGSVERQKQLVRIMARVLEIRRKILDGPTSGQTLDIDGG